MDARKGCGNGLGADSLRICVGDTVSSLSVEGVCGRRLPLGILRCSGEASGLATDALLIARVGAVQLGRCVGTYREEDA